MINAWIYSIQLFSSFSLSILSTTPREPISLTITNLKDTRSPILAGLFRKEDPFTKQPFKNYRIDPEGASASTLLIEGLPYGEYAIALFQDQNGDGKLNTNLFGVPKEPYGFSNNVHPRLSAPEYQQCRFTYSEKGGRVLIQLLN